MITTSNFTLYGMHNNAERHSWAAYHLFVLLSSLIGDSIILYSSFQKDAFKVHQVIIAVIQHIAVSDIVTSLVRALPRSLSLIANSMMIGDSLCYATAYIMRIMFPVGANLIAVLTTSKLLMLKFPLRPANWTRSKAHLVCSAIWIISTCDPVLLYFIDSGDVIFRYKTYSCSYISTAKITSLLSFVFVFVPVMIIIGTTIPTLMYLATARKSARRVGGRDPWQGILAVALTAIVYLVSATPIIVYLISRKFVAPDPTGPFEFNLYRIAVFMTLLNVMSNFYIYALTIRSFRTFLHLKICKISSFVPVSLRSSRSVSGVQFIY